MRRRDFVTLFVGTTVGLPLPGRAQQSAKVPRIGVLWHAGSAKTNFTEFVRGLEELGYIHGRNVILEHRFPNELPDRFRSMAAELVASEVDVLIFAGPNAASYAKSATTTIPIIFVSVPDPIASGLVKSIARPERNVTGLSTSAADVIGKRLEILKETIADLSRTALLVNANPQAASVYVDIAQVAATKLGLTHQTFLWRSSDELETVFEAMNGANIQAVITVPDGLAFTYRATIAKLAIAQRIVLSVWSRQTLDAGALIAYGADVGAIFRRTAVYVDKVLKGSKPSDLPVEGPARYQPLINLKTAKALGLTVPPTLLARANEVIE